MVYFYCDVEEMLSHRQTTLANCMGIQYLVEYLYQQLHGRCKSSIINVMIPGRLRTARLRNRFSAGVSMETRRDPIASHPDLATDHEVFAKSKK